MTITASLALRGRRISMEVSMKSLNWKDRGEGSQARARRKVGGYYRIIRRESYVSWRGETIEAHYEVEYRRRVRWDWEEIEYPRGVLGFGTLAEAKRMAEEDHEQQERELSSHDETAERIHEQQLVDDNEATLDAVERQWLACADPAKPK
jgi:hypothetical protein